MRVIRRTIPPLEQLVRKATHRSQIGRDAAEGSRTNRVHFHPASAGLELVCCEVSSLSLQGVEESGRRSDRMPLRDAGGAGLGKRRWGPTVQAGENGHRRIETSTIDTLDLARGQLPFADARQALPVIGERCVVKHGRETASVESCITSVGAEAAQLERGEARHGVWRG